MLLEESILGWKEYELEVMRDKADNVVIVCSIENLDPMGVHTGDSITVAPAMTLTDREYQAMRDLSIGIIRSVGVDTGGCNIQFAVDPRRRPADRHRDEPAGLPVERAGVEGDRLPDRQDRRQGRDRLHARRDPQRHHPRDARRSFEPTLDYVVVKVPRFAFEKFPAADPTLTTHMKSVGEAMAIGRNFTEALQKALRSLENKDGAVRLEPASGSSSTRPRCSRRSGPRTTAGCAKVMDALRAGATPEEVYDATGIDPWFVDQLLLINEVAVEVARRRRAHPGAAAAREAARLLRRRSSASCAACPRTSCAACGTRSASGRSTRPSTPARPSSPRGRRTTTRPTTRRPRCSRASKPAVIILGSGPNRIGQGIEFDYSCVHA